MQFKVGEIYTHKTTGQYVVVLDEAGDEVRVRLARDTKENGTVYEEATFSVRELESVEQHLRRELSEMEMRQTMLNEAKKRITEKELNEALTPAAPKAVSSVN
jgi:transcription termination factor Rho